MGLLDFFRIGKNKKGLSFAPTNSGVPFFAPFGEDIYASDIIVQSIRCKANEFKKLDPRHITFKDNAKSLNTTSSIARVLRKPNDYMTTADFLEKITILLEINKNVFIYPQYYISNGGEKIYTGLYPLKPSDVTYLSDASDKLFINMRFANGYEVTLPANEVIHWRKDFGVDDFFGGKMFGGNDNAGLLKMLKRYDQLTQSIAKALEVSCQVNGILKVNSYLEDDAKKSEREKFEEDLRNSRSGIFVTDLSAEYSDFKRDIKLVDGETLKFFYETILRANGTPLCILNGDYTKAQKEAYYEHALEADIKSLGQAFTRVLFSDRELSYGNEVVFYPNAIQFMSMENKIAYMQVAVPAGALNVNQILEMGGFPPLPGEEGNVRPQGYNALLDNNNTNKLKEKEGEKNEQIKEE